MDDCVNLFELYFLQRVDLHLVDFSKTENYGRNIFGNIMTQGIIAFRKNHPLIGNLMSKIEEIFFFLISEAEKHLDDETGTAFLRQQHFKPN